MPKQKDKHQHEQQIDHSRSPIQHSDVLVVLRLDATVPFRTRRERGNGRLALLHNRRNTHRTGTPSEVVRAKLLLLLLLLLLRMIALPCEEDFV